MIFFRFIVVLVFTLSVGCSGGGKAPEGPSAPEEPAAPTSTAPPAEEGGEKPGLQPKEGEAPITEPQVVTEAIKPVEGVSTPALSVHKVQIPLSWFQVPGSSVQPVPSENKLILRIPVEALEEKKPEPDSRLYFPIPFVRSAYAELANAPVQGPLIEVEVMCGRSFREIDGTLVFDIRSDEIAGPAGGPREEEILIATIPALGRTILAALDETGADPTRPEVKYIPTLLVETIPEKVPGEVKKGPPERTGAFEVAHDEADFKRLAILGPLKMAVEAVSSRQPVVVGRSWEALSLSEKATIVKDHLDARAAKNLAGILPGRPVAEVLPGGGIEGKTIREVLEAPAVPTPGLPEVVEEMTWSRDGIMDFYRELWRNQRENLGRDFKRHPRDRGSGPEEPREFARPPTPPTEERERERRDQPGGGPTGGGPETGGPTSHVPGSPTGMRMAEEPPGFFNRLWGRFEGLFDLRTGREPLTIPGGIDLRMEAARAAAENDPRRFLDESCNQDQFQPVSGGTEGNTLPDPDPTEFQTYLSRLRGTPSDFSRGNRYDLGTYPPFTPQPVTVPTRYEIEVTNEDENFDDRNLAPGYQSSGDIFDGDIYGQRAPWCPEAPCLKLHPGQGLYVNLQPHPDLKEIRFTQSYRFGKVPPVNVAQQLAGLIRQKATEVVSSLRQMVQLLVEIQQLERVIQQAEQQIRDINNLCRQHGPGSAYCGETGRQAKQNAQDLIVQARTALRERRDAVDRLRNQVRAAAATIEVNLKNVADRYSIRPPSASLQVVVPPQVSPVTFPIRACSKDQTAQGAIWRGLGIASGLAAIAAAVTIGVPDAGPYLALSGIQDWAVSELVSSWWLCSVDPFEFDPSNLELDETYTIRAELNPPTRTSPEDVHAWFIDSFRFVDARGRPFGRRSLRIEEEGTLHLASFADAMRDAGQPVWKRFDQGGTPVLVDDDGTTLPVVTPQGALRDNNPPAFWVQANANRFVRNVIFETGAGDRVEGTRVPDGFIARLALPQSGEYLLKATGQLRGGETIETSFRILADLDPPALLAVHGVYPLGPTLVEPTWGAVIDVEIQDATGLASFSLRTKTANEGWLYDSSFFPPDSFSGPRPFPDSDPRRVRIYTGPLPRESFERLILRVSDHARQFKDFEIPIQLIPPSPEIACERYVLSPALDPAEERAGCYLTGRGPPEGLKFAWRLKQEGTEGPPTIMERDTRIFDFSPLEPGTYLIDAVFLGGDEDVFVRKSPNMARILTRPEIGPPVALGLNGKNLIFPPPCYPLRPPPEECKEEEGCFGGDGEEGPWWAWPSETGPSFTIYRRVAGSRERFQRLNERWISDREFHENGFFDNQNIQNGQSYEYKVVGHLDVFGSDNFVTAPAVANPNAYYVDLGLRGLPGPESENPMRFEAVAYDTAGQRPTTRGESPFEFVSFGGMERATTTLQVLYDPSWDRNRWDRNPGTVQFRLGLPNSSWHPSLIYAEGTPAQGEITIDPPTVFATCGGVKNVAVLTGDAAKYPFDLSKPRDQRIFTRVLEVESSAANSLLPEDGVVTNDFISFRTKEPSILMEAYVPCLNDEMREGVTKLFYNPEDPPLHDGGLVFSFAWREWLDQNRDHLFWRPEFSGSFAVMRNIEEFWKLGQMLSTNLAMQMLAWDRNPGHCLFKTGCSFYQDLLPYYKEQIERIYIESFLATSGALGDQEAEAVAKGVVAIMRPFFEPKVRSNPQLASFVENNVTLMVLDDLREVFGESAEFWGEFWEHTYKPYLRALVRNGGNALKGLLMAQVESLVWMGEIVGGCSDAEIETDLEACQRRVEAQTLSHEQFLARLDQRLRPDIPNDPYSEELVYDIFRVGPALVGIVSAAARGLPRLARFVKRHLPIGINLPQTPAAPPKELILKSTELIDPSTGRKVGSMTLSTPSDSSYASRIVTVHGPQGNVIAQADLDALVRFTPGPQDNLLVETVTSPRNPAKRALDEAVVNRHVLEERYPETPLGQAGARAGFQVDEVSPTPRGDGYVVTLGKPVRVVRDALPDQTPRGRILTDHAKDQMALPERQISPVEVDTIIDEGRAFYDQEQGSVVHFIERYELPRRPEERGLLAVALDRETRGRVLSAFKNSKRSVDRVTEIRIRSTGAQRYIPVE